MQSNYTPKIESFLQEIENFVANTGSSELASFLALLTDQIDQIQTQPIQEIPIIFFGLPDDEEKSIIEQYLGQLPIDISDLNSTKYDLNESIKIPIRLYYYKNLSISEWINRGDIPGIILLLKKGLTDNDLLLKLPILIKRLPLLKILHAELPNSILQILQQETGVRQAVSFYTLVKEDFTTDLKLLSSTDTLSKIKDFSTIMKLRLTVNPLLLKRTNEIKTDIRIKKQQIKQRLSKLEKSFLGNSVSNSVQQIINKRLKQFETLLEEHLNYQFHPNEGSLKVLIDKKLALLDDLQEKKEGKNKIYEIEDNFFEDICSQLHQFYQTSCQSNLKLANTYLQIIQRELQVFSEQKDISTYLAMPDYLVENKKERLIRDAIQIKNNFSVTTSQKKFRDYFMAIREPFFILFMFGGIMRMAGIELTSMITKEYYMYTIPILISILGLTIYNLWSKNLEEKENAIVRGISNGKENTRKVVDQNTKTFSSNWKQLLTSRIKDITTQWQQQIKTKLQEKEKQEKERILSEKNRVKLSWDQLSQQELSLKSAGKMFDKTKSIRERKLNDAYVSITKELKQLFTKK